MRVEPLGGLFTTYSTRKLRMNDPLLAALATYQSSGLLHFLDCDLIALNTPQYQQVFSTKDSMSGVELTSTISNNGHGPVSLYNGPATFPGNTGRSALLFSMQDGYCDFSFKQPTFTDSFTFICIARPSGVVGDSRDHRLLSGFIDGDGQGGNWQPAWWFGIQNGGQSGQPNNGNRLVAFEPSTGAAAWSYGSALTDGSYYIFACTVDAASGAAKVFCNDPVNPKASLTGQQFPSHVPAYWTIGGARLNNPNAWSGLMAAPMIFTTDVTLAPGGSALPALFSLLNARYGLGIAGL